MDLLSCLEPEPTKLAARPVGRASLPERQDQAATLRRAKRVGPDALFFAVFYGGHVLGSSEVEQVADLMLRLLEGSPCPPS